MYLLCSDPSDPNGINKQLVPVNIIEDLNQIQYPVVTRNRAHNYFGNNGTNTPNPFKRKSIAINDWSFDKAKDIKAPSEKKVCVVAVSDDGVKRVS